MELKKADLLRSGMGKISLVVFSLAILILISSDREIHAQEVQKMSLTALMHKLQKLQSLDSLSAKQKKELLAIDNQLQTKMNSRDSLINRIGFEYFKVAKNYLKIKPVPENKAKLRNSYKKLKRLTHRFQKLHQLTNNKHPAANPLRAFKKPSKRIHTFSYPPAQQKAIIAQDTREIPLYDLMIKKEIFQSLDSLSTGQKLQLNIIFKRLHSKLINQQYISQVFIEYFNAAKKYLQIKPIPINKAKLRKSYEKVERLSHHLQKLYKLAHKDPPFNPLEVLKRPNIRIRESSYPRAKQKDIIIQDIQKMPWQDLTFKSAILQSLSFDSDSLTTEQKIKMHAIFNRLQDSLKNY